MSERNSNTFWLSYSDLMTSLFFIMLVLFIVFMGKLNKTNKELEGTNKELEEKNTALNTAIETTKTALEEANASKAQLEMILQLDKQFKELSESSALVYNENNKTFVAKDLIGIEIFQPNDDVIKQEYLVTVDSVGRSLQEIVKRLNQQNPQLSFQLVIEGNAAIPYEDLVSKTFNADSGEMYKLSFRRALALYYRWKSIGLDLRGYNTEILICGSGFNGINRDMKKEDNNKRFVIQITPKVSRPGK